MTLGPEARMTAVRFAKLPRSVRRALRLRLSACRPFPVSVRSVALPAQAKLRAPRSTTTRLPPITVEM
jgi:hypothetical protein